MADQNVKPFHFELTETLHFNKNEGVSEMLGIGLDPEISIETHSDYVSVRGIIALTGEYMPVSIPEQTNVEEEMEHPERYFKRVEQDEEGVCEFLHHFPIDISIPHERIKDVADLTVSIDHFDYHVSDPRKLELEATVQIDGLKYDQESQDNREEIEETTEVEDEIDLANNLNQERDDQIHFDLKIAPEETELVETETIESKEANEETEEKEEEIVQFKQVDEAVVAEEVNLTDDREETEKGVITKSAEQDDALDEEHTDQSTYLLELFDHDREMDEGYSQMKMYIVQEEDSLEYVAEKYQVSLAKLQRANHLEATSIHQGQLIYVPI